MSLLANADVASAAATVTKEPAATSSTNTTTTTTTSNHASLQENTNQLSRRTKKYTQTVAATNDFAGMVPSAKENPVAKKAKVVPSTKDIDYPTLAAYTDIWQGS
jgi:hypothetical protein